jgi:MFS transporter, putative metabolite:H+ symporter
VPAVLLFFVRRYMPESVRYQLSRGEVDEAQRTVEEIERQALGSGKSAPMQAIAPAGAAAYTAKRGVTVFALFEDGRARRTILLWIVSFCFLWSSNGILFMLPRILTQRGFALTQAISFQLVQSLAAVVGYAACGFLIDWYGRRPVLFLYYFIGAFFHLWFAQATGLWMYAAIAAVGWVNPGVFGATGIYVSELHPTYLRATAVGWFFGVGRIGSFLAPLIVGVMLQYGLGAYVLHTFALTFLIAAIAVWLVGVETKGLVLEQIAARATPA